jgi:hypothetical protein
MFLKKTAQKPLPEVNPAEEAKAVVLPEDSAGRQHEASGAGKGWTILDYLVEAAPYIQKLQPIDNMIGVTDRENFLCYLPAKDLDLRDFVGRDVAGTPVPEGDAIKVAVNTGKECYVSVPKEVFGIPFKAVGIPVKDQYGKVIGGLGMGFNLKNQEKLIEMAQNVASSTEETTATVQEMSSTAEHLAKKQNELLDISLEMLEQIKKTSSILDFINEVAVTSNLLGLNAAIEAARAGEQGRGFTVVAEEIRKMSYNSARSVQDIREILNHIDRLIKTMSDKVTDVAAVGQQLSASTQQISSTIQNLASVAGDLEKLAEII